MKTTNTLNSALQVSMWVAYPANSKLSEEDQEFYGRKRQEWIDDAEWVRRHHPHATNYEKDMLFIGRHRRGNGSNLELLEALRNRRHIVHRSVRPDDAPYDRKYYLDNFEKCTKIKWQPGYPDHIYDVGYIEANDHEFEASQVVYVMSDVHYYLSGWRPRNRKQEDWYTCVGLNFFSMPGHYTLPFREGQYVITSEGTVKMKTRSSGDWYCHPLVHLGNSVK